jgi:hypothetical protein
MPNEPVNLYIFYFFVRLKRGTSSDPQRVESETAKEKGLSQREI